MYSRAILGVRPKHGVISRNCVTSFVDEDTNAAFADRRAFYDQIAPL
jgi:hypothetical protein